MKDCALPIDLDSELAPPPVVLLLNRAVRGPDVIAQGGVGEVEEVRVDADVLQETLAHVDVELRVVVVVDVFGRRAGVTAADYASGAALLDLPSDPERAVRELMLGLFHGEGGERAGSIRAELQQTMDDNASVYRTEATLKQAEVDVADLKQRYANVTVQDKGKRYNTDVLEAVELGFLLDLAEVLVVSARARNESRGGHFREDYATRDDVNFMRHRMAYRHLDSDGRQEIRLDYKPVTVTRYQPMERKY